MKKTIALLTAAAAVLLATPARAQVPLYSPTVSVTGTSNSAPLATNTFAVPVMKTAFNISGLSTNGTASSEVFNVLATLDGTHFVTVGSYTNVGTNNFSTNFPAYNTNVSVTVVFQAVMGTNVGNIGGVYGVP